MQFKVRPTILISIQITIKGCSLAHNDAWTKAQVLHRDISVGNIMINTDSIKMTVDERGDPTIDVQAPITGILTDWDLSKICVEALPVNTDTAQSVSRSVSLVSIFNLRY